MIRFLHFADLHMDKLNRGRINADGQFIRTTDILQNLDLVIETAIRENVQLVLFAGDAYESHLVKQEYRSLFESKIMKLVNHGIDVVMIPGNHDMTKRSTSKHALHEFRSLQIPRVYILDSPDPFEMIDLEYVQVIGIPWKYDDSFSMPSYDKNRPVIVVAHCTVWGAEYQTGEPTGEIVVGKDYIIPLENLIFADYVALGHIHRPQVLSESPPVIYPGSCEILTWGEASDPPHGFILGELEKGKCEWELIPYTTRPRYEYVYYISSEDELKLPPVDPEGMYRIKVFWDQPGFKLNMVSLDEYFKNCVEFKIIQVNPPVLARRLHLPPDWEKMSKDEILADWFRLAGLSFDDEMKKMWEQIKENVNTQLLQD